MLKTPSIKANSLLNLIKTLSSILFPLITFPYVSRILGPENVGKVDFGTAFVSYFSLIAALGITTYAIRECSAVRDNQRDFNNVASQIFSINFVTTVLAYVLMGISLIVFQSLESYRWLILIQSLSIIFSTLGTDWINSAVEDFTYITIRTVAFQLVSLALMFLLVRGPDDYMIYAAISVVSTAGANAMNIFYRRKYCSVRLVRKMNWKIHFPPIFFMFVMLLAQTVFSSADITMLGLLCGDEEVGLYSTAHKITNMISQVVSSLVWVVMPRMSMYFAKGDFKQVNAMLRKVFGAFMLFGLPVFVGIIATARETIQIIAGSEYLSAVPTLRILAFSFLFSLVGGSFLGNMVLLPSKQEKKYMVICVITAAFNVITNYLFIPHFGINAAAVTTAASSFLIMVLLLFSYDRRIKIVNKNRLVVSPMLGSALIAAFCFVVHRLLNGTLPVFITCVLGSVLIYALTQYLLRNEIFCELLMPLVNKFRKG